MGMDKVYFTPEAPQGRFANIGQADNGDFKGHGYSRLAMGFSRLRAT